MSWSQPLVLYGSQTGNGESIAKLVVRDLETKCNLKPRIQTLSDYTKEDKDFQKLAKEFCVIVICSTTGQGDVPDNGRQFLRAARKLEKDSSFDAVRPTFLSSVKFSFLGLGDTNYDRFCGALKSIESSVVGMGGVRFVPSAYADDAVGLEDVVDKWSEDLPSLVSKLYDTPVPAVVPEVASTTPSSKPDVPEQILSIDCPSIAEYDPLTITPSNLVVPKPKFLIKVQQPKYNVTLLPKAENASNNRTNDQPPTFSSSAYKNSILESAYLASKDEEKDQPFGYCPERPFLARVAETKILTQTTPEHPSDRVVMEVRFEIPSPIVQELSKNVPTAPSSAACPSPRSPLPYFYAPGDCIGILCPNPPHLVEETLRLMNLTQRANEIVSFTPLTLEDGSVDPASATNPVSYIPRGVTIQELFTYYLDLTAAPRKAVIRSIGEYSFASGDVMKAMGLVAKDGKDLLEEQLIKPRVSFPELLRLFPSCRFPLSHAIEHLPSLKPRYYSISSSSRGPHGSHSFSVALTVLRSVSPSFVVTEKNKSTNDELPFAFVPDLLPIKNADYPSSQENVAARENCENVPIQGRKMLGVCSSWLYSLHHGLMSKKAAPAAFPGVFVHDDLVTSMTFPGAASASCGSSDSTGSSDIYVPLSFHQTPPFHMPEEYVDENSVITPTTPVSESEEVKNDTCSSSMAQKSPSSCSNFKPSPLIMVGAGTGLTPFLGFLEQISASRFASQNAPTEKPLSATIDTIGRLSFGSCDSCDTKSSESPKLNTTLITGSRNRANDLLYHEDIVKWVQAGSLSSYHAALSRERPDEKVYVQDVIRELGQDLAKKIVIDDAAVYVCGDGVSMAKAVQKAVEDVISTHIDFVGSLLEEKRAGNDVKPVEGSLAAVLSADPRTLPVEQKSIWAKAFVLQMIKDNRYKADVWS